MCPICIGFATPPGQALAVTLVGGLSLATGAVLGYGYDVISDLSASQSSNNDGLWDEFDESEDWIDEIIRRLDEVEAPPSSCDPGGDGPDCEASFALEVAVCKAPGARGGPENKGKATRCYDAAIRRYEACRAGDHPNDWPPLHGWW